VKKFLTEQKHLAPRRQGTEAERKPNSCLFRISVAPRLGARWLISSQQIAGIAFGDASAMVRAMLRLLNNRVTFLVQIGSINHRDKIFVTDKVGSFILF
jgi:hypothetical protein